MKDWQLGQRVVIEGRIISLLLTTRNGKELAFLTVEIDDPDAPKAFPRLSITSESPALRAAGEWGGRLYQRGREGENVE